MAVAFAKARLRPSVTSLDLAGYVCDSCRCRGVATYRRTRRAMRSMDVADSQGSNELAAGSQDYIVFNPPSSAPNVYHTPTKFLPKSDPRHKTQSVQIPASIPKKPASSLEAIASARLTAANKSLPPLLQKPHEKKYHLGQEQIDEMRRLRAEDPRTWSRLRLAEKFECSEFFVSLCCHSPEMKLEHEKNLEEVKRRWGRRKREAREDRIERKKLWGAA